MMGLKDPLSWLLVLFLAGLKVETEEREVLVDKETEELLLLKSKCK
jgi:hypothetical protein